MIKETPMQALVLTPSDYRRLNNFCGPLNQNIEFIEKNLKLSLHKSISSGLSHGVEVLKNIEAIKFTHFTSKDVVRHPLVQKIIQAYENHKNDD